MAITTGSAVAQEQITIFSGDTPMVLPNENPVIISQEVGSYLHGSIQGVFGIKCSLQNCLTETNAQGLSFSGQMPSYRAEIQTPESTIVFEPKQADSGLPYGLTMTDIILGLVVIGVVVILVVILLRKIAQW